jgi:hypothetical protein
MKFLKIILLFVITGVMPNLSADNLIILYLRNAPLHIINKAIREAKKESPTEKLTTPGTTSKTHVQEKMHDLLMPKLSGFLATYSGYMDISNMDGLISFPLRHTTPKIYVAITEEIKLIKVKENTISHREYMSKDQTKLYSFERKEDVDPKDPAKKTLFWHVQEMPLPTDNKVNPLTLVIFTKPSNFYVPTGDFIANESAHLVLPEIYVIENTNQEQVLFQALEIRKYFESIDKESQKIDDKKSKSLIKNI